MGLAGYYRKFVKNFAEIAHPLLLLQRDKVYWIWGEEQNNAFEKLKDFLTRSPILSYPDFTKEFLVQTDASAYGVGAVLSQIENENGTEREAVIAYASQHLDKHQVNWSTIEKEAYAIVFAVDNIFPLFLWPKI